jgi:hypothetical protein
MLSAEKISFNPYPCVEDVPVFVRSKLYCKSLSSIAVTTKFVVERSTVCACVASELPANNKGRKYFFIDKDVIYRKAQ